MKWPRTRHEGSKSGLEIPEEECPLCPLGPSVLRRHWQQDTLLWSLGVFVASSGLSTLWDSVHETLDYRFNHVSFIIYPRLITYLRRSLWTVIRSSLKAAKGSLKDRQPTDGGSWLEGSPKFHVQGILCLKTGSGMLTTEITKAYSKILAEILPFSFLYTRNYSFWKN